tara:strand:+ start:102 stop:743 length:642 start_codon:yes stop_codon:yes gene_type:complete
MANEFIRRFGGNAATNQSGMGSLQRALSAGLHAGEILGYGVNFGPAAASELRRLKDTFIGKYGGNHTTNMSGLSSVNRARDAGMSVADIQNAGPTFGPEAQRFFKQHALDLSLQEQLAQQQAESEAALASLQSQFDEQMTSVQNTMAENQQSYADNMSQMQNTLKATMNPNTRESILGIRGATKKGANSAAQKRQGLSGSMGRKGLRIKSLNI